MFKSNQSLLNVLDINVQANGSCECNCGCDTTGKCECGPDCSCMVDGKCNCESNGTSCC